MKSLIKSIPEEELKEIIKNSVNIDEALRNIGYKYTNGTNHQLFKDRCAELNIDYSHFTGVPRGNEKRTEENVFCENSTAKQSTLRDWYIKGKYTDYKCAICGINEWQEKPLTLRLDHINGINGDNRLENLRWVCPNCDSQLETFCKGYKRITAEKLKEKKYCSKCGKEIGSMSNLCITCYNLEQRRVERPTREELKNLIRKLPFTQIASQYGVTDNAIRKWCDSEGLPRTKKEINSFSDEDWNKI